MRVERTPTNDDARTIYFGKLVAPIKHRGRVGPGGVAVPVGYVSLDFGLDGSGRWVGVRHIPVNEVVKIFVGAVASS